MDQTVFYPEGGGQPSDIGYLEIDGEQIHVKHAEKLDNVVLHKIDSEKCEELSKVSDIIGKEIKGAIDWDRRIALARNHTATHLIVASARKILGDHIWQAGAQKGVKRSRIDLSHYKRITSEEINQIEALANQYVMKNASLDVNWMNRTEAEKKYGFILYQGGIVPGSSIRVIEIPEVDVQACAGTHVIRTGDIGIIKINKTERVQDGVERVDFSAGAAAVESMQRNDRFLMESADIFKVNADQLPKTCDRFFSEWKAFKNEINRLKDQIADMRLEQINEKESYLENIERIFSDLKSIRNKIAHGAQLNINEIEDSLLKTYYQLENLNNELSNQNIPVENIYEFVNVKKSFEDILDNLNQSELSSISVLQNVGSIVQSFEDLSFAIQDLDKSSSKISDVAQNLENFGDNINFISSKFNELSSISDSIEKISELSSDFEKIKQMEKSFEKIGDLIVLKDIIDADMDELIKIATYLTEKTAKSDIVIIGNKKGSIVGAASKKAIDYGDKNQRNNKGCCQSYGWWWWW